MRVIKVVYVLLFLKQLKKSECDDTIYQNATTKEGSERTMPKIKDIFDIDNAIAEHGNKIFLLGGVGSGKSTWVSDILTKKGSVLFVTSRKAKVREDVHYTCFSDIFHWNTNGNQTLITNAKLAFLIERIADDYMKDIDEFINHFDYVVVDEVHSIATDSAYAESCSAVLSFIEYAAEKGKVVVCMTGTPEPIKSYFDENGWYTADYIDVCDYVHPHQISLIKKSKITKLISKMCRTQQIIYFANRTDKITALCKELLENNILNATEIAVAVSKNREDDYFISLCSNLSNTGDGDVIKTTSEEIYNNIIANKRMPDECRILFSTSVLKEGINIQKDNVVMFCENHVLSNLIQFFGRVRHGASEVYVIEDSTAHSLPRHNELLHSYALYAEASAASHFYDSIKDSPHLMIERENLMTHVFKNPYIYFDYIRDEFRVFSVKFKEEARMLRNTFWQRELLAHCKRYDIKHKGFDDKNMCRNFLLDSARKHEYFWGKEQKASIQNLFYIAYGITAKQPQGINEKLAEKNIPIKICTGKGNAGGKRNVSYWQLWYLDEYDRNIIVQQLECENFFGSIKN